MVTLLFEIQTNRQGLSKSSTFSSFSVSWYLTKQNQLSRCSKSAGGSASLLCAKRDSSCSAKAVAPRENRKSHSYEMTDKMKLAPGNNTSYSKLVFIRWHSVFPIFGYWGTVEDAWKQAVLSSVVLERNCLVWGKSRPKAVALVHCDKMNNTSCVIFWRHLLSGFALRRQAWFAIVCVRISRALVYNSITYTQTGTKTGCHFELSANSGVHRAGRTRAVNVNRNCTSAHGKCVYRRWIPSPKLLQ